MLYNTGTIDINGNAATGTGTNWAAPASQVRAGQTIIVMSNPVQMFQISNVNSATSLTVTPAASPALSGQKYGILVSDNISVDGLAQAMSQLIKEYDENIGAWETFASTSANQNITVTINGSSLTIPAIGGLARKGANNDITELKGLTKSLTIEQGGTGASTKEDARINLGLVDSTGAVPISLGGTGGKTAAEARNNFGLGWWATSDPANLTNVNSSLSSSNNPFAGIGFYNSPSAGGPTTYGVALQMYLKGGGGISITQEAVGSVANQVRLFARNMAVDSAGNTTFGNYVTIRHSGNTTVATDGTLKAASPVVKILNDGTYETNDESEGVTVTRLGVGQYLIEGCEALNSDAAWGGIDGGFDIPTDRNKQPLIWLDYEVNADGSVLVKTYHRTHPGAPTFARNERDGLSDGDPVDIPLDQFVSVRVQMPIDSAYNSKQIVWATAAEA